jgi:hypothetical protein
MKKWFVVVLALMLLSIPTIAHAKKGKECGKGVSCGKGQPGGPHTEDQSPTPAPAPTPDPILIEVPPQPEDDVMSAEDVQTEDGDIISPGFDPWGYNYKAHKFKGPLENVAHDGDPVESSDTYVMIKWNNAYLSNYDCDDDGMLDPHCGNDSYAGSGAWLTNHVKWTYIGEDGREHKAQVFIKLVAKPSADFDCASIGGVEVQEVFCEIQRVYHDAYQGAHGLDYKADSSGLGGW